MISLPDITAYIKSVSNMGEVVIQFSDPLIVPKNFLNLTQIALTLKVNSPDGTKKTISNWYCEPGGPFPSGN